MKLLIILYAVQVKALEFAMVDTMGVTIGVLEKYHTSCLYILHSTPNPDYSTNSTNLELMKNLIKWKQLQIGLLSMKILLDKNEGAKCQENLPFYLILTSDDSVQTFLNEFSRLSAFTIGRWLIFLRMDIQLEHYFHGINIPYNCEFIIVQNTSQNILILTEVYRQQLGMPLQKFELAKWFDNRLHWTNVSLLKRRGNLQGDQIRVSIFPEEEKYVKSNCKGFETEEFCKIKYEVWNMIEREANAKTVYIPNSDETVEVRNTTWNGGLAQLILNKTDVAISTYGMTAEGIQVVSYLSNAFPSKLTTYIRKEAEGFSKWDHVIEPFSPNLWCTIFFSLVVFTIVWSTTWYITVGINISPRSEEYGLKNTWIHIFGCFCQQGLETTPQAWSCRLIYLTASLTYVILISSYSAVFISFLTVEHHEIPFTTYKELLETESYDFGTYRDELYVGMFQKATNPALREVYEKFLLPQLDFLPEDSTDGLQHVCEKNDYAFAFVVDEVDSVEPTCEIMALPGTSLSMSASFAIGKNNPYYRLFNHYMENLRRFGFLAKVNAKQPQEEEETIPDPEAGMEDVSLVFMILIAGLFISLLCLAAETYNFKYENKFKSYGTFIE